MSEHTDTEQQLTDNLPSAEFLLTDEGVSPLNAGSAERRRYP
jgi:hypothetical protein